MPPAAEPPRDSAEPRPPASSRRAVEEALRESERQYRALFESIDEGFCVVELLFDPDDRPVDYRFLEANPAFERHTGLVNAVGRKARELVPDLDPSWFRIYGNVALTGEGVRFENEAPAMGRSFDVYAFRIGPPERRRVAILFTDITERRRMEAASAALLAQQSRIAEVLQQSLLMTPPPEAYPGMIVSTVYQAASDNALIGGDFFDVFPVREGLVALVAGDNTGKGVEAANKTAEVKFALRMALRGDVGAAARALARLNDFIVQNRRLCADHDATYVALTLALVDTRTGEVACACAGAEPPLVLRKAGGGGYEEIPAFGPLLGVEEGSEYTELRVTLAEGDLLVLTTDGITEARRPPAERVGRAPGFLGADGLVRLLLQARAEGATSLPDLAREAVSRTREWAGGAQHDDICLVLAQRALPYAAH